MKFLQHYYTSCIKGWGTAPGFQTKAKSQEIGADILPILEKRSRYQIPYGNDPLDTENQPVSFSSFPLDDKRHCISLIQYVGVNFDNRPGNFFAHNLVCTKEELRQIDGNPFGILRAGCFVKESPDDELELDPIDVTPVLKEPDEIYDFFCQNFEAEHLRNLLNAILISKQLRRKVILALPQKDIAALIEGLILLLPPEVRFPFSFSTYQLDPYAQDFTCVGVLSGSKSQFRHTREEYDFQYLVFNFEENRFSEVPSASLYAEWMIKKLREHDYATIQNYFDFTRVYDIGSVDSISGSVALYALPSFFDNAAYVDVASNFVKNHANSNEQMERAWSKIIESLDLALKRITVHQAISVLQTAISLGVRLAKEEALKKLCVIYADCFEKALSDGDFDTAATLMDNTETLPSAVRDAIYTEFFSTRFERELNALAMSNTDAAEAFSDIFLQIALSVWKAYSHRNFLESIEQFLRFIASDQTIFSFYWQNFISIVSKEVKSETPIINVDELLACAQKVVDEVDIHLDVKITIQLQLLIPLALQTEKLDRLQRLTDETISTIIELGCSLPKIEELVNRLMSQPRFAMAAMATLYAQADESKKSDILRKYRSIRAKIDEADYNALRKELYRKKDYEMLYADFQREMKHQYQVRPKKIGDVFLSFAQLLFPPEGDFYKHYYPLLFRDLQKITQQSQPNRALLKKLLELYPMNNPALATAIGIISQALAEGIPLDARISDKEARAIGFWLSSEKERDEQDEKIIVRTRILFELRNLRAHAQSREYNPIRSQEYLTNFQKSKHLLDTVDYMQAVLMIFSTYRNAPWTQMPHNNWEVIEEIVYCRQHEHCFASLIADFLRMLRRRRDYIDILAGGTFRWIKENKAHLLGLLSDQLVHFDKRELKRYEAAVRHYLESAGYRNGHFFVQHWNNIMKELKGLSWLGRTARRLIKWKR